MSITVQKESTDVTVNFRLNVVADRIAPAGSLTITDLDMVYVRDGATPVKADATALGAVDAAHSDNTMIEVGAANMPGQYRADFPDAAFAGGADHVKLVINGTEIDPAELYVDLEDPLNIAATGASVNVPADSYVLTTGNETENGVSDTGPLDLIRHTHTDAGGEMELYYEFDVTSTGVPSSVHVNGYLNSANDDLEVYAWNWGLSQWDQIGIFVGKGAASNAVQNFVLFTVHVGTDDDRGKVRVRFFDGAFTLTNATLAIDQMFVSYGVVTSPVGYANGQIWVDTLGSNENTDDGVDGVADNAVSTWAAALTLSATKNIKSFHIVNGSTITLSDNSDNFTLTGDAWALELAGQSISGASFCGATNVSGAGTGAEPPQFDNCKLFAVTLPPSHLTNCRFGGTLTAGSAGTFEFLGCRSAVAGTGTPTFDFGGAVGASAVNFRAYSGGTEIENMGAGDTMSYEGFGQIVVNANCSAGTVAIRGAFTVTDNASGAVTLSDNARIDIAQILAALTSDDVKLNADFLNSLNDITAASVWAVGTRTLTSFGTLVADTVTAVWGALTSALTTSGSIGKLLVDNIDSPISGVGGSIGSGADTVTLTLTDGASNPIADADVWVSNDSAGSNVVAGTLQTNSSGEVAFLLDAGVTYYRWAQKDGVNFTNPTSFVAVAD